MFLHIGSEGKPGRWLPLIPPATSRRSFRALCDANPVDRQRTVAADQPAIPQDGDVLPGHEEIHQATAVVQDRAAATPFVAGGLGATDLVPLDADDVGAGHELLEGRVHQGERARAVDRRRHGGLRSEDRLDRSDGRLLDRRRHDLRQVGRGRRVGSGTVLHDDAEAEHQQKDQSDAHRPGPGLHGPQEPIAVAVGERIDRGDGHGSLGVRVERCDGPNYCIIGRRIARTGSLKMWFLSMHWIVTNILTRRIQFTFRPDNTFIIIWLPRKFIITHRVNIECDACLIRSNNI